MRYMVEYDTIAVGGFTEWYTVDSLDALWAWVFETLEDYEGGHADIYDEDGDFVDDVEV